jgi:hypothetical protein
MISTWGMMNPKSITPTSEIVFEVAVVVAGIDVLL